MIVEVVSRPKPVTAMQRQREKEEKRRKKLERAKEKKKKKGAALLLVFYSNIMFCIFAHFLLLFVRVLCILPEVCRWECCNSNVG